MLLIGIITICIALALCSNAVNALHYTRLTVIIFIICGLLTIEVININMEEIGKYSILVFQSNRTMLMEILLFLVGVLSISLITFHQVSNNIAPKPRYNYNLQGKFNTLGQVRYFSSSLAIASPKDEPMASSPLAGLERCERVCSPLHSFENVEEMKNDEALINATKDISGIYVWENIVSLKLYVGSAVNLRKRTLSYMQPSYIESKKKDPIIKAINKHGIKSFILHIVEYTDSIKNDILAAEQKWIDKLQPEYNQLKVAGSSQGYIHTKETRALLSQKMLGKKLSEDVRKKISLSLIGEKNPFFGKTHSDATKALISQKMLGKKISEDVRKKISLSHIGENNYFFGKKHTDERKALISQKMLGNINKPSKNTSWVDTHIPELGVQTERSITLAAKKLGTTNPTLIKYDGKLFKNRYKITIAKIATKG